MNIISIELVSKKKKTSTNKILLFLSRIEVILFSAFNFSKIDY